MQCHGHQPLKLRSGAAFANAQEAQGAHRNTFDEMATPNQDQFSMQCSNQIPRSQRAIDAILLDEGSTGQLQFLVYWKPGPTNPT
jgi:hypothetical protein